MREAAPARLSRTLPGSHAIYVSKPEAVAALIAKAMESPKVAV